MNASHISTFCSYVDLLRPEYGILENVVSMGATRKGLEDQNVLRSMNISWILGTTAVFSNDLE
jgi:DNA (cytosine-5)-methyltransferase 1